jgi:hypothetical protein
MASRSDARLVELARGADLLGNDAQYTAEELQKRRGWGHSSFDQAMQVAEMAGVKRLALTHHDPDHDDEFLERIEKLCRERFPNAVLPAKEWKSRSRRKAEPPVAIGQRPRANTSARTSLVRDGLRLVKLKNQLRCESPPPSTRLRDYRTLVLSTLLIFLDCILE